ncbi:MAG TPA: hypothetical protein G4O11_02745 [Anaerolineae bacterium]|nr:MAG: hypothetical protein AMJ88_16505 [Anaerolineae bacterium SM23_ 63]HEY42880.1 hypothetical protein [Anaerolineae bacterium]
MAGARSVKMERKDLEARLAQILVPVEPNPRFLKRLRARLVTYQGGGLFSGWMIVVVLATALLLAITALGLLIRLILGWLNLLGFIGRKRSELTEPKIVSVEVG